MPVPGPDLHLHSTASDGTVTPSGLVRLALSVGCPAIALTDHDTVDGVPEALAASSGTGLTVIPAVELSAGVVERGLHILGYHIDHTDPALRARLERLRAVRIERAERIVFALSEAGFALTIQEVLDAADGGSVGRAHIAQRLVATGQVPSVHEAFVRLLGSEAPFYVPKPVESPEDVLGWIRDAGGVPVLAHPGLSRVDDLIPSLVEAGLGGIEAYHPSHDEPTTTRYAALAADVGILVTGGSDFHGLDREGDELGSVDVPWSVVGALQTSHAAASR